MSSVVIKDKNNFQLERKLTVDNGSDFSIVFGKANSSDIGIVT